MHTQARLEAFLVRVKRSSFLARTRCIASASFWSSIQAAFFMIVTSLMSRLPSKRGSGRLVRRMAQPLSLPLLSYSACSESRRAGWRDLYLPLRMNGGRSACDLWGCGLPLSQNLIWKNSMTLCHLELPYIHRPILYGWEEDRAIDRTVGANHHAGGECRTFIRSNRTGTALIAAPSATWLCASSAAKIGRLRRRCSNAPKPAQLWPAPDAKPVGLVRRMISNSARKE